METMFRLAQPKLKLCGAEIVCPKPIGSGVSTAAYDCESVGRNFTRGTARMALITFGERRMPCLTRLSISFSQSVFSKQTPEAILHTVPF
jgi:hypothetical protein